MQARGSRKMARMMEAGGSPYQTPMQRGKGLLSQSLTASLAVWEIQVERIKAMTWRRPIPKRSEHGWTKS
jgi:hypothetical protein